MLILRYTDVLDIIWIPFKLKCRFIFFLSRNCTKYLHIFVKYKSNEDKGNWEGRRGWNTLSNDVRYKEWDHNVEAAWEQCLNGSTFTIAIVDDGLHEKNPDIERNYVSLETMHTAKNIL